MKTALPIWQVLTPEGIPFFQTQSRAGARALAIQTSRMMGSWPPPHVTGSRSPLYTVKRLP